jgi:DNA-binding NarL/FixJ family response regulator
MVEAISLIIISEATLISESLSQALRSLHPITVHIANFDKSRALEAIAKTNPEIALVLSESQPAIVIDLITALRRRFPETKAIVLSMSENAETGANYLEAGARGHVRYDAPLAEIVSAISYVRSGAVVSSGHVTPILFGRLADLSAKNECVQQVESLTLSLRELDVLQLIASGLSNEQIAAGLSISVHTVKNHVHNILYKLQVKSRLQAVQYAYEKRWLHVPQAGREGRVSDKRAAAGGRSALF